MDSINQRLQDFIVNQKVFFVGTAASDGRVNVSPKGMDTLRVINPNLVVWLNLTGSGNETAAHLLHNSRMTIMFCSFSESPLILRLYGTAEAYHERDEPFHTYKALFPELKGSRQVMEMKVDLVHTSCGFGVPLMEFQAERNTLKSWTEKKGEEGIKSYWKEKNTLSLDGYPTDILNDL